MPAPIADRRRAIAASVVVHAAVLGLASRAAPPPRGPQRPSASVPAALMEFEAPPPPPAPLERAAEPAANARVDEAGPSASAARRAPPRVAPPAPAVSPPPPPMPAGPALPSPPPPRIDANEVLRHSGASAMDAWTRGAVVLTVPGDGHVARDVFSTPRARGEEGVREASVGYVRRALAETHQHEPPGVRGYFWSLRRRMEETWRPGVAHEPSVLDALVRTLAMPAEATAAVLRSAAGGAVEPGRQGAAADALDGVAAGGSNHPASRNVAPFTGIVDASRGLEQRTRAEVEVVQDESGRVVGVRIVRSSRIGSFDTAAMAAVREALPLQTPVSMPGGRRSRWSFEVVASRDPFVPGVGFAFDESSGWFELHYPGRLHLRSRVWLEGSSPTTPPS